MNRLSSAMELTDQSLTKQQLLSYETIAANIRRKAVNIFETIEEIHNEVLEALLMAKEARDWTLEPIPLSIPKKNYIKDDILEILGDDYQKVDSFFRIQESIVRKTIHSDWLDLDSDEQVEEIFNAQKEMSKANKKLDIITQKKYIKKEDL